MAKNLSGKSKLELAKERAVEALCCLNDEWSLHLDQLSKKPVLKDLCLAWMQLQDQYEQIDEHRKSLYAQLDRLSKGTIPAEFERQELDKIAVPEVARSFYPITKYSASMVNKADAFDWLRKEGAESLITETVNSGTLAAYLSERLVKDNMEPPECLKLTTYKITSSSKYTPKK